MDRRRVMDGGRKKNPETISEGDIYFIPRKTI